MRVAIIGATGLIGVGLVPEAASRGHRVTALCRHPEQVPVRDNVAAVACDIFETETLTEILRGHDAVIHSYSPRRDHDTDRSGPHVAATVMEAPQFPPEYVESAISTGEVKKVLATEGSDLDWTFLAPSLFFDERGRSGVFRLGLDEALFSADGNSSISIEDYAIAMIDELEDPRHTGRRFTVGY
jgi:uncharacterized protein